VGRGGWYGEGMVWGREKGAAGINDMPEEEGDDEGEVCMPEMK